MQFSLDYLYIPVAIVLGIATYSQTVAVVPPVVTVVRDPGPTSVMLSWEALPDVTHYNISFVRSLTSGFIHSLEYLYILVVIVNIVTYSQTVAVVPPVVTVVGDTGPKSVMLSWEALPGVTRYEVSFERSLTSGFIDHRTQCGMFRHNGTIDVGNATVTEYTLNDLEEDSKYTITVTAVYVTESYTSRSASSEIVVTTMQAGNINSTSILI